MLPRVKALVHGAVLALALVLGTGAAPAQGQEPATEPAFGIEVHAFLSQGFVLSTDNNYLTRSKDGSVEFTEAAVNFTKWISDDFRVGIQLFARKLTPSDDYVPIFDWYYADYRIADWLGVRAGRTKIPFGLYNETNDVDAARVPILLPQSIYPDHHRELLLAQNGGEIYGTIPVGVLGGLEYRLYGGTFSLEGGDEEPNPNLASAEAQVSYIAGGRVLWMTPLEGLIAGLSLQSMRYEIDSRFKPEVTAALIAGGVAPADYDGSLVLEFPITLWVASIEHTFQDVTIAIEYGRWWADLHSSVPALIPSSGPTNERFYAMASYRVNEYFVPGMYFASYYEDVDAKGEPGKFQHDLALTLRFDITPFWLVKAEGHLIRGTALLSNSLNDDKELKDLESRWGLFLLKTTAYF